MGHAEHNPARLRMLNRQQAPPPDNCEPKNLYKGQEQIATADRAGNLKSYLHNQKVRTFKSGGENQERRYWRNKDH